VVVTVCEKTELPPAVHTCAVYEVAPVVALQSRVGVMVVNVVPGDGIPPGARGVGLAGAVAVFTVKYNTEPTILVPAALEADTPQ
jgi:hypothetical protein